MKTLELENLVTMDVVDKSFKLKFCVMLGMWRKPFRKIVHFVSVV